MIFMPILIIFMLFTRHPGHNFRWEIRETWVWPNSDVVTNPFCLKWTPAFDRVCNNVLVHNNSKNCLQEEE